LNNTCSEFTGVPLEKLRDDGWLDLVHPDDLDGCVSVLNIAAESHLPFLHEYRLRGADGDYRWLLASAVPKHGADGSFVGYIGCDFDITERKEVEGLIEQSHREIQQLAGRLLTAHEDERRRLARELHDDLTQRLARLAIDAGGLEQRGRDGTVVKSIREELVRLSDDVHAMSYRLHPSVLDDLGLVEALKTECDRVARRGSLRVEVDANGVPTALPADASLCLFRVAQEALSNASRHAGASAVTVLLTPRDSGLELAVRDDGSGFDPDGPRGRASLGLASMRERVRLLNGRFDIESAPGRGTRVVAWVPETAATP
jgi:PAS domain S-box-containing protein